MDLLRRALRDIVAGHSRAVIAGRPAYIRHLSHADHVGLDERREAFYAETRASGIPTEAERLEQLKREGAWSDAKEQELTRARQNVDALREGTAKARRTMPSAVKDYLRKISEAEAEHEKLAAAKRRLVGLTCETAANEDLNDFYIATALYADPGLTVPLYPPEEFEHLRDDTMGQILQAYNAAMEGCSDQAIRRLAMSPLFQRQFQLCGDDFTAYFGRPICHLTFAQTDLLRHGAHFRHIYQTHDVSKWKKEVLEDPDLMTEYAASVTAKRAELDAQGAHEPGTIVVGAAKEDAAALGVKAGVNPIRQITQQFGGDVLGWAAKQGR